MLADVELAEPAGANSEGSFWLDEDGVIGTVPLPGGKWRIFAELPSDDPLAALGRDAATASTGPPPVLEAVLDRVGLLLRKRVGFAAPRIISGSWTSVFRFHRRIASAYRRGRVFIAGDAAHIHSALGGQGMNTGLGDVFNLGWKLTSVIRGQAEDRLLDTYEAERRPVAAAVVRKTTRDWNIMIGRTWFDRMFRDHVLLPLLRKPSMQQRWLESGSQLRVSYRGGPLARMTVRERWSSMRGHAPLAGDRAPNAVCRLGPSGAATTLGALIGANWALLLFGGAAADRAACVAAAERRLAGPPRRPRSRRRRRSLSKRRGTDGGGSEQRAGGGLSPGPARRGDSVAAGRIYRLANLADVAGGACRVVRGQRNPARRARRCWKSPNPNNR